VLRKRYPPAVDREVARRPFYQLPVLTSPQLQLAAVAGDPAADSSRGVELVRAHGF